MTTIKLGSTGEAVKQMQTLLGGDLKADGKFGKLTRAALIEYQTAHGLTADGICGAKTWASLLGTADSNVKLKCEDIKQFSAPHGSMIYGGKGYSNYANGGCCPTALAVVQRALGLCPEGETQSETVLRLGRYAYDHGYRIKDGGTYASLFQTNGTKSTTTYSGSKIEEALRAGKFVILLIKAGFPNGYGGKGHYVVAYGIENGDVLLRDVGSSKAGRQIAALAKITNGLKGAYIIEKRG